LGISENQRYLNVKNLISTPTASLSNDQLSQLMFYFNDQYRAGTPVISDAAFDFIYMPALKARLPEHPLITKVQPEAFNAVSSNGRYKHTKPMLSTQKAYELHDIQSFVERCKNAADALGITDELLYRVSPKLDGLAASYISDHEDIYSRGDGFEGYSITHLYRNGLKLVGDSNKNNIGEVVVVQDYFETVLKAKGFAHPRNFVAGLANSNTLSDIGLNALKDGAIHLVFFDSIECPSVTASELINNLDSYCDQARNVSPYLTDGTVIEVTNEAVKQKLGHNNHHHLWQIARKSVGETAEVEVIGIEWQVGRNKITPVIQIVPTWISGATISKLSGHHAGYVQANGIGKGALLEVVRSGEIIPSAKSVISSVVAEIPTECPCCKTPVAWKNDFIVCTNDNCTERQVSSIEYHFQLMQAVLFGRQSVRKIVEGGFKSIGSVYSMTEQCLLTCGFGAGQAANLIAEINRIKATPVLDYLVLASIGIHACGRGSSKRILKHVHLANISELNSQQLKAIEGFGEATSVSICNGIQQNASLLAFLSNVLNVTDSIIPSTSEASKDSALPLIGLNLVFTGKMESNRDDMSANAEKLGANVQSSVGKTTNYLVIGQNVGQTKLNAAKDKGVKIITESEYRNMIAA
jgi:DNA ligase (NAD+)